MRYLICAFFLMALGCGGKKVINVSPVQSYEGYAMVKEVKSPGYPFYIVRVDTLVGGKYMVYYGRK